MDEPPLDLWYASRSTQARHAWKYVIGGTGLNGCLLAAALLSVDDEVSSEPFPYLFMRWVLAAAIAFTLVTEIVVTVREVNRYSPMEKSTILAAVLTAVNIAVIAYTVFMPSLY